MEDALHILVQILDIVVIATLAVVAAAQVRHRWQRTARRRTLPPHPTAVPLPRPERAQVSEMTTSSPVAAHCCGDD